MKTYLIAAGMAATMLFGVPALAAPVAGNGVSTSSPQDMRDGRANDRDNRDRADRDRDNRDNRDRADRDNRDRGDRGGWSNNNDRRWGWNNRRCHNVRRHHRWVRVCGRR